MKTCRSCGGGLPKDALFCPYCGERVEPIRDVYHPVSVMFVDIVGYTRLVQNRPPEDVAALTTAFFELLEDVVRASGGMVYQKLGDGALCVFGYPRVIENSSLQALQACLTLLDRLKEVDPDLQVHGGVATGKVLVVPGKELRFVGEVMNLAARLEGLSGPGEFFTDATTFQRARHAFHFDPLGSVEVPGFGHQDVFALKGADSQNSGWRNTPGRVFVGRERELLVLEKTWSRFEAGDHHPVMVRIQGEPGVGKTRLMLEFLSRVPSNRVLVARALPYGMPASGPILHAIRRALSTQSEDLATSLFGENPNIASRIRAYARDLLPEDAEEAVEVLVGIFASLLMEPRIFVLDDIQWADKRTFDVIRELFHRRLPLFFLVGARPPDPGQTVWQDALEEMEREIPSTVIRLQPFTREESWLFWEVLSDMAPDEQAFERALHRSGGIPLFLEEIHNLLESGNYSTQDLPDRAGDILRARLNDFPASAQRFLECASLMGPVFPFRLVIRALGYSDREGQDVLNLLRRHHMLDPGNRITEHPNEVAFRHVLLQEAVLSSLPRDRLRHYARTLMHLVEEEPSLPGFSRPQLCARLAWLAGEKGKAARHLLEALEELTRIGDWGQASRLMAMFNGIENDVDEKMARELVKIQIRIRLKTGSGGEALNMVEAFLKDHPDDLDAYLLEAEILEELGDFREAHNRLSRIQSEDPGFRRRQALTLLRLSSASGREEDLRALRSELAHLSRSEDPLARVEALLLRLDTLPYTQVKERIRLCRQALSIAEAHNLNSHAQQARNALIVHLMDRGFVSEAFAHLDQVLESARNLGNRKEEALAIYNRAWLLAQVGAFRQARSDLEHYRAMSAEAGYRRDQMYGHWLQAFIAKGEGNAGEMLRAMSEASTLAWRLGLHASRAYLMDDFAHLLMEVGRPAGLALARWSWDAWPHYRKLFFLWRWDLEDVDPEDIFRHVPHHLPWSEWLDLLNKMMDKSPRMRARLKWKARKIYAFVLSQTPENLKPHLLNHPWYGYLAKAD